VAGDPGRAREGSAGVGCTPRGIGKGIELISATSIMLSLSSLHGSSICMGYRKSRCESQKASCQF
jgi:hypothetical protein